MSYRHNGLGAPVTRQASSTHTAFQPTPIVARQGGLVDHQRPVVDPPPPAEMTADEADHLVDDGEYRPVVDPATLLQPPPTEIPWTWIGIGTGAVVLAGGAWWFLRKKKVSANRRRGRRHRRAA